MLRLSPRSKKSNGGLASDLDAAMEAMRRAPWTALAELKGDPEILRKRDEVAALLNSLRKTLSPS
jgi:ParB family chromosome partitioning protein